MINAYFQRLYKYNQWANTTLLALLNQGLPQDPTEIMVALSHYLAAQDIWISRIKGEKPKVEGVWAMQTLDWCNQFYGSNAEEWNAYIPTMQDADYHRIIAYKNTQGNYYETPVIDIMAHCINHATYHRAQIARMLRLSGIIPVNTDFITYARLEALPALSV